MTVKKKLKRSLVKSGVALALFLSTSVLSAQQSVDIPAQPLADALKALGQQTGLTILYDADLITGKQSPAVQGEIDSNEVLRQLLDGSNVTFNISENTVTLTAVVSGNASSSGNMGTLPLSKVGSISDKDGSAEVGYRVEQTNNIGPLSGKSIQNTPYSLAVLPGALIENTIAANPDQIFRMSPTIQLHNSTNREDNAEIIMRGFSSSRGLTDGIPTSNYARNLEDVEQVEILTGTSGFLYGAGNVGGRVNYNYKRPTQERLTKLILGNYGGEQYFAHADLGGVIGDGNRFGYRLNLVKQDGETALENENVDKLLVTGAFDWHISDNLLTQLVLSHRDYKIDGQRPAWVFISSNEAFEAPDISKAYGPEWARLENKTNSLKFDITWDINQFIALRSSYFESKVDSPVTSVSTIIVLNEVYAGFFGAAAGDFLQNNVRRPNQDTEDSGANIFLDVNFNTAGIQHNMTLGYSSNKYQYSLEAGAEAIESEAFFTTLYSNIDDLKTTLEPDWSMWERPRVALTESSSSSLIVADEITFNEQWSTQLGVNYSSLKVKSGDANGWSESYDKSALTPTVSILYKPVTDLTTYFTYMEALEPGTIVGANYTNAGEILEPLLSEEIEVGVKYELKEGLLLTAALFRIEKPNEYSIFAVNPVNLPTFVQDGLAVHQGIELGFTGKLTPNLTLLGGVSLMDISTKKSNNPDLEGERPQAVADNMAKVYAEYTLPSIRGLVLTGGLYYTGSAHWNQGDDTKIKAYTLADIGLRYSSAIADKPVAFRLAVTNVADNNYWLNRFHLGSPRTVAFSMSMNF